MYVNHLGKKYKLYMAFSQEEVETTGNCALEFTAITNDLQVFA